MRDRTINDARFQQIQNYCEQKTRVGKSSIVQIVCLHLLGYVGAVTTDLNRSEQIQFSLGFSVSKISTWPI